jgi:large subunit ribosomal protein L25
MKAVALTAFPRSQTRRKGIKQLRAAARVPAVIYGRQVQTRNLELQQKEIEDLLHHAASGTILVDLTIPDESNGNRLALVQDVQHHPLTGRVLHVDFHQVAEDEKVTVTLAVESVGEAVGVKAGGGVLEHVLFKIKVRGLPKDLPEVITVDVTNLNIGEAIHLSDITLPPGVEALGDSSIPVMAVAAPLTEAQEAATLETTAGGPTEPVVLSEKKELGSEGAAAGDKKSAGAEKKGGGGEKKS